jgi:hypothetical protein
MLRAWSSSAGLPRTSPPHSATVSQATIRAGGEWDSSSRSLSWATTSTALLMRQFCDERGTAGGADAALDFFAWGENVEDVPRLGHQRFSLRRAAGQNESNGGHAR